MNIVQIKIYNINEIPNESQRKAWEDYTHSNSFEFWIDEGIESIQAFCHEFNCDLTNYEISPHSHSFIKSNIDNDSIREMKKKDLPPKTFSPTGYYIDSVLIESFYKHYTDGDILYAFKSALDDGLKALIAEMEYQESFEYFLETARANEYQFLADGTWY